MDENIFITTNALSSLSTSDPNPVMVTQEPNPNFCTLCSELCINPLDPADWEDWDGWTDMRDLRESADGGCVGCSLLVQAVLALYGREYDGEDSGIQWAERRQLPIEGKTIPRVWNYEVIGQRGPLLMFELFTLPGQKKLFPGLATSRRISGTADTRLEWAKNKLQKCLAEHSLCNAKVGNRALTSRVVDVKSEPVRLCDFSDDIDSYFCLSHCWGDIMPPCRTTVNQLKLNKEGIDWEMLPKTFQDAIIITREFDVRYLWIDSICIIQDDEEDWTAEAAKMAGIYAGSLLTISATTAEHDDEGFISTAPEWIAGKKLNIRAKDDIPFELYARRKIPHHTDFNPGVPDDEQKTGGVSPIRLLSRGWVYQERLLSPRLLRFDKCEMVWDCKQNTSCECGQFPTSPTQRSKEHVILLETSIKIEHAKALQLAVHESTSCVKRWRQIVGEYSRLALTREQDKLVAIAGLAQEMKQYRPDELYLAGLWERSLFGDMLWETFPENDPERSVVWRRPSWSWLSVTDRVSYSNEVQRVTLFFPKLLKISGNLENNFVAGAQTLELTVQGQLLSTQTRLTPLGDHKIVLKGQYSYRWDENENLGCDTPKHSTVYCLRMAELTAKRYGIVVIEFWLLLACCDKQKSIYSRLGILSAKIAYGTKSPFEGIPLTTVVLI